MMPTNRLAVYTLTRDRLADTRKALAGLYDMAGCTFDHFIFDNGSEDGTDEWLREFKNPGGSLAVIYSEDNKGQCIASNIVLDMIRLGKYDFVMRYDNDITPVTPSFVSSLVEASRALGPNAVVSPAIKGLLNMPQAFAEKEIFPFKFGFVEILGGACRLMPMSTLEGFRFTEHGQLSLGEAAKFAAHCTDKKYPMAYVRGITVEHDTAAHVNDNPAYFKRRRIEDFIPYGL